MYVTLVKSAYRLPFVSGRPPRTPPLRVTLCLLHQPRRCSSATTGSKPRCSKYKAKMARTRTASSSLMTSFLVGRDAGQEPLQCRPVEVAAGIAAVVVAVGQAGPAGMGLAVDIGFRRFALGVQRVEVLVETFFGALAGVDGTAHWRGRVRFG